MSNTVLMAKSKIGQHCTRLFLVLDWMEGKISKAEFQYETKLIEQSLRNKQLIMEFKEVPNGKGNCV